MSVYGGDSWGREAQSRKRRVDDLLAESLHPSRYAKLTTGKFACLVCPNNPTLDSPLMLSMHCKGSQHRRAESKLKERELKRQFEMNKRMALSLADSSSSASKPLTKMTRDVLENKSCQDSSDAKVMEYVSNVTANVCGNGNCVSARLSDRELKFTAAGWKRDGHGKWYKDENVEFDSDEEDPNICLV